MKPQSGDVFLIVKLEGIFLRVSVIVAGFEVEMETSYLPEIAFAIQIEAEIEVEIEVGIEIEIKIGFFVEVVLANEKVGVEYRLQLSS